MLARCKPVDQRNTRKGGPTAFAAEMSDGPIAEMNIFMVRAVDREVACASSRRRILRGQREYRRTCVVVERAPWG